MANTYVDYTGDNSETDFIFNFDYLQNDHVKVKVNDVIVTNYSIVEVSANNVIRFDTAPASNASIRIYRDSRGDFSPLVDFVDGSVLTGDSLDEAYKHNLFVSQEASEGTGNELLNKKGGANYDAEGNKIINLGTPTTGTDAANKGYVDQTIDNAIALGGSPAIVSLGGYDVTSSNDTLKQLRAWTADIEGIADGDVNVTATGSTTARSLEDRFADVVNVLDYGVKNDGTDYATGDNNTTRIQAAINAIPNGGTLIFPVGTYALTETSETGSDLVNTTTGTTLDTPDYIILKLVEKYNITVIGYGATLTYDRGYVFYNLLCENINFKGFTVNCNNDPHSTSFTPPSNWQPSAVVFAYSMNCHVSDFTIYQAYRGLMFTRTAECSALNNKTSKTGYMGLSSYGDFFQPAGWTGDALTDRFNTPGHSTDSGIVFKNNTVSDFKFVGIYSDGRSLISGNRVDHPIASGATPGPGVGGQVGVQSSEGNMTITGNRFYAPMLSDLRDGTRAYRAVDLKLEDISDGSTANNVVVSDNWIDGCFSGISMNETANSTICNNIINNYTANAINLVGASALGSNIYNTIVTNNVIGNVDTATTVASATYKNVGGIVTSTTGSGYFINKLIISSNVFNRKYNDISDATAQTNHRYAINVGSTDTTGQITIEGNRLLESTDGLVFVPNTATFQAKFNGLRYVTSNFTILEGNENQTLICDPPTGNITISLPTQALPGVLFTIINRTTHDVTFDPPAGSTVSGSGSLVLSSYSSVVLTCLEMSTNGTAQTYNIVSSDTTKGGTLTLV